MSEVNDSNEKYERIMNKMKLVFVDNPLYEFISKKDKGQIGKWILLDSELSISINIYDYNIIC